MEVARRHLTALFNRLYDRGDERFAVAHPADEIGTLFTIELGDHDSCTVTFETRTDEYVDAKEDLRLSVPEAVLEDLPEPADYVNAVLASGVVPIANEEAVADFLDRYGDPDLMAGHPPVVAGFDTNLLPWRIDEILGLRDPARGLGYVNGFALATGVRDELDWDYKCSDTGPFVDRFGSPYEAYWNQPLGAARIGRLGLVAYRTIRDIQQADEIESERGDEAIIDAYDIYNDDRRRQILLFSNDRNFVERATGHTLLGQHVAFPPDLPRTATATWRQLEHLLYTIAVVFGVIEIPATTVHGVWRGKDGQDWQHERLSVDCRSPDLRGALQADLTIVERYEALETPDLI